MITEQYYPITGTLITTSSTGNILYIYFMSRDEFEAFTASKMRYWDSAGCWYNRVGDMVYSVR
jgi:hypothetical protein